MAGRHRYMAADSPYFLERDAAAAANYEAQVRMQQRQRARDHSRYEDDEDLALSHYGCACHVEDLGRTSPGYAGWDRGLYPPVEHRYDDMDPQESGRSERPYHGPLPYDAADEELGFGRRRRRPIYSPPLYHAANDDYFFNEDRSGDFRGHGLGNDRYLFYARDAGMDELDEGSFRDMDLGPRNLHSRHGLRGSHDMSRDHLSGLAPRARRAMESRLCYQDDELDILPREGRRGFGLAGVSEPGPYCTEYHFEDDFEYDSIDGNFRQARWGRRPCLTGYRSDLDFRSVDDDIGYDFAREFRAPTAAEIRHRASFFQTHDGLDVEDREWERREAQVQQRYTEEDFEIEDIARRVRDRRRHMPRTVEPHPADDLSDGDIEGFNRGGCGNPFRPRQAGTHQNTRANGNAETSRGRSQQAPPAYVCVTPAQVTARAQDELANNVDRPLVAGAVAKNANLYPVTATVVDNTAKGAAKELPRGQNCAQGPIDHADIGGNTRHRPRAGANSNNPRAARATREVPIDSAHTSRAEVGDDDRSDSSDSGSDTPDEGVDTAGDSSEGSEILQSFIHITL